jgi:hypothetical protein
VRTLVCFVLRFAILFGLLVWPWTGPRDAIRAGFSAQVRWLVGAMLPPQAFRVETYADPAHPTLDTLVDLADRKTPDPSGRQLVMGMPFDSVSQGWIPFAMLIALIVATPLPRVNRLRALLAGALFVQLLVAVTILVGVSSALRSGAAPAWPRLPLMLANHLLVENIWFGFVAPFLFWAGWLAWGGHWERLESRLGSCGGRKSL